jgi:hypothetical protein
MAARYWVGGGSSSNWNATGNTNWGTASGVQDNASVPTSADDVIFDGVGTGGNTNSTISATTTVLSINITSGYTATLTHNAVLTVTGNVTFGANYIIAGSSAMSIENVPYANTSLTVTTNNRTWPNALTMKVFSLGGTLTVTMLGNLTVNGLLTLGCVVNKTTTEVINCTNGITTSGAGGASGTVGVVLKGGTWSATGELSFPLSIDGNVTVSGTVLYAGTMTYVSGTVTTTGSTLSLNTSTLNTNGITWNNIKSTYSLNSITLTSNLSLSGILDASTTGLAINKTTSETVTVAGGIPNQVARIAGTAEIILTGGTISTTGVDYISNPLTFNGNVTVSGTLRYISGVLKYTSGSVTTTGSTLAVYGSCTINTNGIVWNNITVVSFGATITLASNFTATGSLTLSQVTTINKTASETFSVNGMVVNNRLNGNGCEIILTGGTWSGTSYVSGVNISLNGNVTVSGTVSFEVCTLKYISGAITTTGSTLNCYSGGITLDTVGITWNNVSFGPFNSGATLTSDFVATGVLSSTTPALIALNTSTGKTFRVNGISTNPSGIGGTATFILTGGNWVGRVSTPTFQLDGNITVSGTVSISGCTLKYVSGNITTTGSTLSIIDGCSLDTNGVTWNNVTYPNTLYNENIISLLSVSGTLTVGTNGIYFTGTAGWTCGTLLNASTGAATINLKDGNTYTINTLLDCYQSRTGSIVSFTSSHVTNRAFLTLTNGASCRCLANFTRINATGGRPIRTFNGTVTDSPGVVSFYDLKTVALSK